MFITKEEKEALFRWRREADTTIREMLNELTAHIRVCAAENTARAKAEEIAVADRRSFRKEIRGYCIAIVAALIGLAGAMHWGAALPH